MAPEYGVSLYMVRWWVRRARDLSRDQVDRTNRPPIPRRIHRTEWAVEDPLLRLRRELKESSDLGECGARALNHYLPEAHAEHTVIEDPGVAALQGQSTFLRKFDEGERNRQRVDLQLQIMLTDALAATPTFSYRYDYIASRMGLQEETSWSAGMDFNWTPHERVSFSASYLHEVNFQQQRSRSKPFHEPLLGAGALVVDRLGRAAPSGRTSTTASRS